jgi:type IV pilus assembly protein PilC
MTEPDKHAAHTRFWKKYLRLTRGRVPILRTLKVIGEEERDPAFKNIVFSIRKDLETDSTLSEAIAKHKDDFSSSIIELVKAAEQSGAWDEILQEIVEGLKDDTFE